MHVETIACYLYAKENKREKQDWHLPREQRSDLFIHIPYTGNNYDNPLRISFEDIDMANKRFEGTVRVLVPPGDYYKVHTNQLNAFEGPVNW